LHLVRPLVTWVQVVIRARPAHGKSASDIDNPMPQFEQLIEQIKAAVTPALLKPGAALPSILPFSCSPRYRASNSRRSRRLTSVGAGIRSSRHKGYPRQLCPPRAKANARSIAGVGPSRQDLPQRSDGRIARRQGENDSEIRMSSPRINRQWRAMGVISDSQPMVLAMFTLQILAGSPVSGPGSSGIRRKATSLPAEEGAVVPGRRCQSR